MARSLNPAKPLEEPDDKVQHGVADLMLCHVSGQNAAASEFAAGIIPNELLKSFGQLGNETIITRIRTQGILNFLNILTKIGIRLCHFLKKLLNFVGEGFDGFLTTTILPRHPQDPVDGLLQVGGAGKRSTKADKGYMRIP
ncbi:uncharacterized protein BcabD6B2_53710 [Babesia caballi]|uniref:Uncharacterized protein n=1 Tax=Babesia caballi TaxID=5871 RepID=A0AAV4M3H4_BABCB|nr:hypothetical protein BcabD6B2_53710 [Babesia caballi]